MPQAPSAGGESPDDALPGFDIAGTLMNLQCDLHTFKEILLSFYRQRKDNHEKIATVLSQGDIEKVKDIAHGIKGSSGYLGAWHAAVFRPGLLPPQSSGGRTPAKAPLC